MHLVPSVLNVSFSVAIFFTFLTLLFWFLFHLCQTSPYPLPVWPHLAPPVLNVSSWYHTSHSFPTTQSHECCLPHTPTPPRIIQPSLLSCKYATLPLCTSHSTPTPHHLRSSSIMYPCDIPSGRLSLHTYATSPAFSLALSLLSCNFPGTNDLHASTTPTPRHIHQLAAFHRALTTHTLVLMAT